MSVAKKKQTMTGVVVSNKMLKTVVVLVTNKQRHKQYGKYVNRASKILAHSANPCKEGDTVIIESCRPISKNKSWMVVNVLSD